MFRMLGGMFFLVVSQALGETHLACHLSDGLMSHSAPYGLEGTPDSPPSPKTEESKTISASQEVPSPVSPPSDPSPAPAQSTPPKETAAQPNPSESTEHRPSSALPRILILATDDSLDLRDPHAAPGLHPATGAMDLESLLKAFPELRGVAELRGEQVFRLDSRHMDNAHWLLLARRAQDLLDSPWTEGLVITQRLDGIEETAYFLHLVLKTSKPVVLTAVSPLAGSRNDGSWNHLHQALQTAGSSLAQGQGVLLVLNGRISGARSARWIKHGPAAGACLTDDSGFLGWVQGQTVLFQTKALGRHTQNSYFHIRNLTALPRVDIAMDYANAYRTAIDAAVAAGTQGIVFAGTGEGSIFHECENALASARKLGVAIVRVSREVGTYVFRNRSVNDEALGFVAGGDLSPQKARILLMLALTRSKDPKEIQKIFDEH